MHTTKQYFKQTEQFGLFYDQNTCIPSNLTAKLNKMTKVVLVLKLDD